MLLVFVHGWGVKSTATYGELPQALVNNAAASLDLEVTHLFLGKYVSFADEVTIDDIARGMQNAVESEILPKLAAGDRFACITHSTGAPVVRQWIDLYHGQNLEECPLGHLVMLAPANHGSALAQLGKSRISRLKFQADEVGIEPGTGVLDWLELGSDQSWELNRRWLTYDCAQARVYPFVLIGQTIDRKLYDNLNPYTGEPGSDGVVRVAAANMNYGLIRIVQPPNEPEFIKDSRAKRTPMGVLPGLSHSGESIGIMRSVQADDDGTHPTVRWILRCLGVDSHSGFSRMARELERLTNETQKEERTATETQYFLFERTFTTNRYCMLVMRIIDDRGNSLSDYDVLFTAGPSYDTDALPPGFLVDRQRNQRSLHKLTFFLDYDVMKDWFDKPELDDRFGFRVTARPTAGFAYYQAAEFKGRFSALRRYFEPNQTVMIEVELQRTVDEAVFQLTQELEPEQITGRPFRELDS